MSLSIIPKTCHAPAERACFSQVAEEYLAFCDSHLPAVLTDDDERMVLTLNRHRQLIYANRRFLDFLGLRNLERILGLRLGEILGCTHATDNLGGCGTQQVCIRCSAIGCMLAALEGHATSDSCSILVERDRRECLLKFDITATPFEFRGGPCLAVYLTQPVVVPLDA